MTTITSGDVNPALEPLRAKSGWIIALGAVYIIAGLIALGSVAMATVATVFVVGIMMLIAGVAEVFTPGVPTREIVEFLRGKVPVS